MNFPNLNQMSEFDLFNFLTKSSGSNTSLGNFNGGTPGINPSINSGFGNFIPQSLNDNLLPIGQIGQNAAAEGEVGGNFLSRNFKNSDGTLDFGNIAQGVGVLGDVLGAYMGIKQFGLAKDAFKHSKGLDLANLNNNAELAQNRLDLQAQQRAHERPDLYGGQTVPQLRKIP